MFRPLRLGLQLGLFQLSFGVLSVLILGLINRLLIEDIELPAALAAVAVGAQQLMGFTRVWFGHRSDRISATRLRRTPFILASSVGVALFFWLAVQVVLQLADAMQARVILASGIWFLVLVGLSAAIGTAIAAGGTTFSALVTDRTSEQERPRVLSVVWGMRLLGVLLGTVLVNQVFGSACDLGAGRAAVLAGLNRLSVVVPLLLLALGIGSVWGVERRSPAPRGSVPHPSVEPQRLAPLQLLRLMRTIPQAGRFMAVLCLFTFSMFLNDAVLEPYGAAVFGMSVCATTALNASLALGFFVGMLLSGFQLIHRIGNIRAAQWGAGLAAVALALLLLAAPLQSLGLLRLGVTLFGLSLGICMNACLTLMFNFVQPGQTGFLLGVWGAGYAYSCGLATITGGGLLTLFQSLNGGDPFGAYAGVFALQIVCFLSAAALTERLDVMAFRQRVQSSFGERMQLAVD